MVTKRICGNISNKAVYEYTIKDGDLEVRILEYGATIQNIFYKGVDCILGYDNLEGYITGNSYQGATVGRYANRIAKGKFTLNSIGYNLDVNNNVNSLHGGFTGFSHRVFDSEIVSLDSVTFTIFSPDMEGGFPGNMTFKVNFTVQNDTLKINYFATSDKDTIINFTNHAYFNLGSDTNKNTLLKIAAEHFTPVDENMIPTGELRKVKGTPFDFTEFKPIGQNIKDDYEQLDICNGYDHNFVLGMEKTFRENVICAKCEETGIALSCSTDMPGVQLYAACFLDEQTGKNGKPLEKYSAFCLETQLFPDTPNRPEFPSCVLKADDEFSSVTEYKFYSI